MKLLLSFLLALQTLLVLGEELLIRPNYLYRLDQQYPDKHYPSGFTADVRYTPNKKDEWTQIAGFDVPFIPSKWCCRLLFQLAPEKSGWPWVVEGSGQVDVYSLASPAKEDVTWNNRPKRVGLNATIEVNRDPNGGVSPIKYYYPFQCAGFIGRRLDVELVSRRPLRNFVHWPQILDPKMGIWIIAYPC